MVRIDITERFPAVAHPADEFVAARRGTTDRGTG